MHHSAKLAEQYKDDHDQWARNHMNWIDEWQTVLFSDEKKFNLNSSDERAYYWHDIRKEPKTFLSRQKWSSLMMWIALCHNRTIDIVFFFF